MLRGAGGSAAVDVVAVPWRRLPYQFVISVSRQTTPAPPADCWDIWRATSQDQRTCNTSRHQPFQALTADTQQPGRTCDGDEQLRNGCPTMLEVASSNAQVMLTILSK